MLDIEKLISLRKIINLKALCRLVDVNYYTVKTKTLLHQTNPNRGELTKKETNELQKGLELKGLKLTEY